MDPFRFLDGLELKKNGGRQVFLAGRQVSRNLGRTGGWKPLKLDAPTPSTTIAF